MESSLVQLIEQVLQPIAAPAAESHLQTLRSCCDSQGRPAADIWNYSSRTLRSSAQIATLSGTNGTFAPPSYTATNRMYFVLRSALEDVNFRLRRERRIPYKVCELLILCIRHEHFHWSRVCRDKAHLHDSRSE
jgi:hypothetical protein